MSENKTQSWGATKSQRRLDRRYAKNKRYLTATLGRFPQSIDEQFEAYRQACDEVEALKLVKEGEEAVWIVRRDRALERVFRFLNFMRLPTSRRELADFVGLPILVVLLLFGGRVLWEKIRPPQRLERWNWVQRPDPKSDSIMAIFDAEEIRHKEIRKVPSDKRMTVTQESTEVRRPCTLFVFTPDLGGFVLTSNISGKSIWITITGDQAKAREIDGSEIKENDPSSPQSDPMLGECIEAFATRPGPWTKYQKK